MERIERKNGDWDCHCGQMNFASRDACWKCGKQKNIAPSGAHDWKCGCGDVNFAKRSTCRSCGKDKVGARNTAHQTNDVNNGNNTSNANDWTCHCGTLNFSRRTECMRCQAQRVAPSRTYNADWACSSCGFSNFKSRTTCNQCGATKRSFLPNSLPSQNYRTWECFSCGRANRESDGSCYFCSRPKNAPPPNSSALPTEGYKNKDWTCSCGFLNFRSRDTCKDCSQSKPRCASNEPPKVEYKEGDWFCQKCQEMNFASRDICRKCSSAKIRPKETQEEEALCVVCLENPSTCAITVCGHLGLCEACGKLLTACKSSNLRN